MYWPNFKSELDAFFCTKIHCQLLLVNIINSSLIQNRGGVQIIYAVVHVATLATRFYGGLPWQCTVVARERITTPTSLGQLCAFISAGFLRTV